MKKILALSLALVMALGLCACGTPAEPADDTKPAEDDATTTAPVNPANDIPDTMTSEDGTYELAFVTDVGQLKDTSCPTSTISPPTATRQPMTTATMP